MKRRSLHAFKAAPRRQRGAVLILVVVAMAAILMMSALALDGGHMLMNKARLQNAVDAAALSGAKTLSQLAGEANATVLSRDAALRTLTLNASALGNGELKQASTGNDGFAVVEFSTSVYGPFSYPGPEGASYVRVSVPNYGLAGFFWSFVQSFGSGSLGDKSMAAIATAGPSPSRPCGIAPMMVCGDPAQYDPANGLFWGYRFGDLVVLKTAANSSSPIGPGNFQFIRLEDEEGEESKGASDIRTQLCQGIRQCYAIGNNVPMQPGNIASASQGLNTIFGQYHGPVDRESCPPDLVATFTTPRVVYNDEASPSRAEYLGQPVTSSGGDLSASTTPLLDYNDWKASVGDCPSGCEVDGVYERRMLKIVVGNCNGKTAGADSVPLLGFGCFFLLQSLPTGSGNDAHIFGQFIEECVGDNVPGP